jgi:phosphatidylinositol-3-phosphatase
MRTISPGGDHGALSGWRSRARRAAGTVLPLLALLVAGCTGSTGAGGQGAGTSATSGSATSPRSSGSGSASSSGGPTVRSPYSKVLVIAEENETLEQVLGGSDAPYLSGLATSYGSATNMDAGDPVSCPSLPSYLIMTSGDRYGICDDDDPSTHPITGPNIFQQVAASGRQWRNYAESMPTPCLRTDSPDGLYAVRHAPAAYYLTESTRCQQWDIPMGTPTQGALRDDLTAGTLPAYGFISPNVCDDMHGGASCAVSITSGDTWLHRWIPAIMAGADYRRGDLVIVITWDEGSDTSNHIPALVISPTTRHVSVSQPLTLCSFLRAAEDILQLSRLGCAAQATSAAGPFHLTD